MSDAGSAREWRFYLDDMIGFCERVQTFTRGLVQAQFEIDIPQLLVNLRTLRATEKNDHP